MLRARLILFLFLGTTASACVCAQSSLPLKDGQPFHAVGRLEVVYRGWQRFLVVRFGDHLALFQGNTAPTRISALELNTPGQFETLAEHAGEQVEAAGTLQLDKASPYYWNGVALLAQTVTLPGGTVIRSQRVLPRVPAGTDLYTVTGDLLPDPSLDGCSLNGGGDVMNCICTQGFTPVRAGIVPHPLPTTRWREIPTSAFALPGMAQFGLPDPGATHAQIVQVACKRKGLTTK